MAYGISEHFLSTSYVSAWQGKRRIVEIGRDRYIFCTRTGSNDLAWRKASKGGQIVSSENVINSGTVVAFDVWYDKWTPGNTGTKIHIFIIESSSDDALYYSLDTATDSLSTVVTIFAGASAGTSAVITGAVMIGGNILVAFNLDSGTETGVAKSADGGGSFSAANNAVETGLGVNDNMLMFPGNEADDQDGWLIYWDTSANEISLKVYDDSGDSWSETSISTGMTAPTTSSNIFQLSGSINPANNHLYLAVWSAQDSSTADLRTWDINGAASITSTTDVVTNSDDCAMAALSITPGGLVVVTYAGKSDGSQTWGSSVGIYQKYSADNMSTWGPELTVVSEALDVLAIASSLLTEGYIPTISWDWGASPNGYFSLAQSAWFNYIPTSFFDGNISFPVKGLGTSALVYRAHPHLVEFGANRYLFFINEGQDLQYTKSTDRGKTWSVSVNIHTATYEDISIYFDRWTIGNTGTIIHIFGVEANSNNIIYHGFDLSNDTVATGPVTVFDGASVGSGPSGQIDITGTCARGGNLLCIFDIDAGTETGTYKSTDGGDTWSSVSNAQEGGDYCLAFPGNEADNQDIWLVYWDRSANEISLKVYDDSGDSWSETSISTGMTDISHGTIRNQFAGTINPANGHLYLAAWNSRDVASTSDLLTWDINGAASITSTANIVTDADDSAGICLSISPTGAVHATYIGKGDGSETLGTSVGIYRRSSSDAMVNWSTEYAVYSRLFDVNNIDSAQQSESNYPTAAWIIFNTVTSVDIICNVFQPLAPHLARSVIGEYVSWPLLITHP